MNTSKNSYIHTYAPTQRVSIDLTLSENPLGPSPKAVAAIIQAAENIHVYPDDKVLIAVIARHHNVTEDRILLGAGANGLLEDYLKVFALGKKIIVPTATFPESVACMKTLQGFVEAIPLRQDFTINLEAILEACSSETGLIHLCNPNNPTGIWTNAEHLLLLAERSSVPILISEAGADFLGRTMIDQPLPDNIIIVRSFSKSYGLAGLRIGYSVASPSITAMMKSHMRSYRVGSLEISAATAAINDRSHLLKSINYILQEKAWLMNEMSSLGFKVIPSGGQTFIAEVPEMYISADHFCAVVASLGVAVVNCSLYAGLERYIRISPQKHLTNKKLILILKKCKENSNE